MAEPILTVESMTKSFGGLVAVDDVTIEFERGRIFGIIGPNGAGKSTLLNLISGFYEPDEGTITFDGQDITDLNPAERANRGMIRTFQITRPFAGMTVTDNLRVAYPRATSDQVIRNIVEGGRNPEQQEEMVEYWLNELDLTEVRDEYAGNLSGGQQKLLELGRALIMEPEMLLLDEPMAGVNPALTDELTETILDLKEEGITFALIEHDVDLIMSISDEVVAMAEGKVLTQGPPDAVQQDEAVLESYLGGQ